MEKAIIILTGTPSGKGQFDRIIMQHCWRWNISAKNWLAEIAKTKLYWKAQERDEDYHRTLANFYADVNKYFDFEENNILEAVERFKAFDKEEMSAVSEDGTMKVFTKFLLVIHGISRDLTRKLAEEEGALQIHITARSLNTNVEHHDLVYYEDDEDFVKQIEHIIDVLTSTQKEKIVDGTVSS